MQLCVLFYLSNRFGDNISLSRCFRRITFLVRVFKILQGLTWGYLAKYMLNLDECKAFVYKS